ncbi:unnamed protein product [Meganyctiphanes norvegica]|uniref:Calpain catalytic domain-containing protein n=1 Tax=Meganyctiphanes norvegica TaxID=48144 RepID=A0AAV2QDJ1_MEGNR
MEASAKRRKIEKSNTAEKNKILYNKDGEPVIFKNITEVSVPSSSVEVISPDFHKLRDKCLADGRLYEDPTFPALDSSVYFSKTPEVPFQWKRPKDICENPKLFIDGGSRFDIKQGDLGNCWFLAATANLTRTRKLFHQVVTKDQNFQTQYAGIFHFRFWQYGKWVEVVVDDRLPTFDGKLVFMHSQRGNEFWSALMEKAYAKLHGSYESLEFGSTCEGMEDLTGGVSEKIDLSIYRGSRRKLFKIMLAEHRHRSLMGCSLTADPDVVEAKCKDGLIRGHTYSVTKVKNCRINTLEGPSTRRLLRLRNPWGDESEWKGAWSDKSSQWEKVSDEVKNKMDLTFDEDGEFWMSIKEFCARYDELEITTIFPTHNELGSDTSWELKQFEGAWMKGLSAGGCYNFTDTFHINPQYLFTLSDQDDDDIGNDHDDDDDDDDIAHGKDSGSTSILISLLQKHRRSMKMHGKDFLYIGFAVYQIPDSNKTVHPLDKNFLSSHEEWHGSDFTNMRGISLRLDLPPGTYCIIPSTYDPDQEGEFLIRIISEKKIS